MSILRHRSKIGRSIGISAHRFSRAKRKFGWASTPTIEGSTTEMILKSYTASETILKSYATNLSCQKWSIFRIMTLLVLLEPWHLNISVEISMWRARWRPKCVNSLKIYPESFTGPWQYPGCMYSIIICIMEYNIYICIYKIIISIADITTSIWFSIYLQ